MRSLPFLLLLLLLTLPAHAFQVPPSQGYVTDLAGILSPDTKQQLEQFLSQFEASDSTQIVVLTIPSLEGETVESAALKVAESWRIGQKGKDNGALLLIAKEERKVRIEVGYGLEGRLTDLLAGRIIDQEITPRFKAGDFDGGVIAGVNAMVGAVRGEYKGNGSGRRGSNKGIAWLFPLLFFGLPLFLRLGLFGSRRGGYWIGGGGGGFGGSSGGGGFSGGGGGFGGGGSSGSW
jgi:uncharacterized protein